MHKYPIFVFYKDEVYKDTQDGKLSTKKKRMLWEQKQSPDVLYKKVFLTISQNSQENTCARVSLLIKKLIKFTFFTKTSGWLIL